jgi:uncharacterized membrane protein
MNPVTMAIWGLFIAGALLVGSLPLFVGLAVVLPVLGHSSWHLYRKVVKPAGSAFETTDFAAEFRTSAWPTHLGKRGSRTR